MSEARFFGEHQHSLDSKGRLILPAKFRATFSEGGVVTGLPDRCLGIFTPAEFERRTEAMVEQGRRGVVERRQMRVFSARAVDFVPDKQGRFVVPANLREFAGLASDVVVIGAINHLEVWSPEAWDALVEEAEAGQDGDSDRLSDMAY